MVKISKKLLKVAGRVNGEYQLIGEGDRVLLGLSGGKDSLTLLHILNHMRRHAPFKFEFEAITIGYGMGESLNFLTKHCNEYDIKHTIYQTETFDIAKSKIRKNSSFCSFFSRMRRGALYTYARENGFNKLALAHHLDDAIESFFMNSFYNGTMRSMPPIYRAQNSLLVIRPLIFARERQMEGFVKDNNLTAIGDEACPAMRFDVKMPYAREKMKNLLRDLEREYPDMFVSMKSAFSNIQESTFFQKERLNY